MSITSAPFIVPFHAPNIKTSKMTLPKALDDQRELLRVLAARSIT